MGQHGIARGAERAAAMIVAAFLIALAPAQAAGRYPWRAANAASIGTLAERIAPPPGFQRTSVEPGGFADWLRGLPLKPPHTMVRLYDGRPKWNQQLHVAVIDVDTGNRDLQQCADAVMRLRAEYLLSTGRARDIGFNDTKGKPQPFTGDPKDYAGFRRYLDKVYAFAGSYSLEREMRPVPLAEMRIGDVFIKGGFPGHAVLVVDMAANPANAEKRFLLMQSYMPAQDMHVLKNPKAADGSPWYAVPGDRDEFVTPEWTFPASSLRRFKN
jgi:hypothetical protein